MIPIEMMNGVYDGESKSIQLKLLKRSSSAIYMDTFEPLNGERTDFWWSHLRRKRMGNEQVVMGMRKLGKRNGVK